MPDPVDPPPVAGDFLSHLDSAMRKVAVVWLTVPGTPPYAVWPLWHDRALRVLSGGGEQPAPGLVTATDVVVAVPARDVGTLLLTFRATAEHHLPGSPAWEALVPLLVAKRLNLRDAASAPARWAQASTVTTLWPVALPGGADQQPA